MQGTGGLGWKSRPPGAWRCLLILLCSLGAVTPLRAQDAEHAYFAGVAYTSDAADISKAFPYVSANLSGDGVQQIDQSLHQQITEQKLPLDIVFDQLGTTRVAQQATALALAIDRESTSVEQIGARYKVRIEIDAQALFFNFKSKQILGGYPFTLEYIDTLTSSPSSAYIQGLYRNLIFGGTGRPSVVSQFVATIQQARVPSAAARHLRITRVVLAPKARQYIQTVAPDANLDVIKGQIAQQFGEYLAADQDVSLLPYASNQALGGAMPARFVEGGAYDLKIPPADYDIAITVDGFKKIVHSKDTVSTVYIYGAFATLSVKEPLSGHVYFSQAMRQGAAKVVPVTEGAVNDWAASYETLLVLFNNFAKSISTPHASWVRSAMPESNDAQSQLHALKELIQSCR